MKYKFLFAFLVSTAALQPAFCGIRAGAAKSKITPVVETFTDANKNGRQDEGEPFQDLNQNGKWDPVWLAGYQGGRSALGVHDDLWARALAVSDEKGTVLLISLDLIGYLFDEVARVKKSIQEKLKIEPSRILISSTHGHSSPDTIGLWGADGKSGKDPEYLKRVRDGILECAEEAVKNQRKASFIFAKARYSNPIEDSRPPKVINDLLLSFRVTDDKGQTIATAVNYAMHAEVLNGRNRWITADYPGVLRDELEKHFGGVAFFFPGDIGGMQSPFVFFHSFWSSGRVGRAIAGRAIASLKGADPVRPASFTARNKEFLFPIENPRFVGAIQKGVFGESEKFVKKSADQILLPADVSFLEIGPARILTVPGELFPELGHVFRDQMASEYPFLIGLCNNEIGYIVPDEVWRDGGYEETMSLGPKTAAILKASISEILPR